MQYEADTTNRKEKLLISKQIGLNFDTKNTFCMEIFFLENSSKFLFLGKPRSQANKWKYLFLENCNFKFWFFKW